MVGLVPGWGARPGWSNRGGIARGLQPATHRLQSRCRETLADQIVTGAEPVADGGSHVNAPRSCNSSDQRWGQRAVQLAEDVLGDVFIVDQRHPDFPPGSGPHGNELAPYRYSSPRKARCWSDSKSAVSAVADDSRDWLTDRAEATTRLNSFWSSIGGRGTSKPRRRPMLILDRV